MTEHIVVMARRPQLGMAKTRLAKGIGEEKALEVYKVLLNFTLNQVVNSGIPATVFWTGEGTLEMPNGIEEAEQVEGDLGQRMLAALRQIEAKHTGSKKLIIGTDCPDLFADHLVEACSMMNKNEVVLGPGKDGGYYLLGMKEVEAEIFQNIPWSTHRVLHDTRAVLSRKNIKWAELESLNDVDTLADLKQVKNNEIFRALELEF